MAGNQPMHGGEMTVVGVGFTDAESAEAAARDLRRILDVDEADVIVGPIGGSKEFVNGFRVLLGGRIRELRLPAVEQVMREHGGTILTEVPEHEITWGAEPGH
jgi:hypothetical protein